MACIVFVPARFRLVCSKQSMKNVVEAILPKPYNDRGVVEKIDCGILHSEKIVSFF